MSHLGIEPITSYDTWLELEPIWNPLLERSDANTVFLTFEWLTTWWQCFGGDGELLVLVVRRAGEPIALAPLMVAREPDGWRRRAQIRFLANAYSMRANFILADERQAALEAIFDYLGHADLEWERMAFDYMPEDSSAHALAPIACRRFRLRCGYVPSLLSPYTTLAGADWDAILGRMSPSFRKQLLRRERKLLDRESARAIIYSDRETLDQALDACREVALTTWQHARGSSIASSHNVWEFYRRFAEIAAARGWLRIAILEARGEPIAFAYDLLYRRIMYDLKNGYRPASGRHSPGHVLKASVIREALASGAAEYDMLGMNEEHKMQWATGVRRHACLCVAGPGLAPALGHWLRFEVKPRLRRWPPAMALKQWLDARERRSDSSRKGLVRSR
jgi:CelD/BcsL family acetyltransferase involved in cellulose biosynthesis